MYCNGFIINKLIYWSGRTHNHVGWRPKSLIHLIQRQQGSYNGIMKDMEEMFTILTSDNRDIFMVGDFNYTF